MNRCYSVVIHSVISSGKTSCGTVVNLVVVLNIYGVYILVVYTLNRYCQRECQVIGLIVNG